MFSKTFSFWRRLVGQQEAAAVHPGATAVADDRRLWARYATDLQRPVQLHENLGGERILVQVRDLSVGGANLVVDRKVEPGQMLSLELRADGAEPRTLLACVVRTVQQAEDRWALGCVFSRELDADDLRAFGADKMLAARDDQRIWTRFPAHIKVGYRPFGDLDGDAEPGEILNISPSGIGLVVHAPLDAGAILNLDLFDRNDRKACSILACVVHITRRADNTLAIGCNFIRELREEELESLLSGEW